MDILKFVQWWAEHYGATSGFAVLVYLVSVLVTYKMHKDITNIMQKEIDRLAEDNHRFRDLFLENKGYKDDQNNK